MKKNILLDSLEDTCFEWFLFGNLKLKQIDYETEMINLGT